MKQRIITGLIGGAGFLYLVWTGNLPYSLLILTMALVGYYEFVKMNQTKLLSLEALIGFLFVFNLVYSANQSLPYASQIELSALLLIVVFLYLFVIVVKKNQVDFDQVASLFLGALYIGLGFSYMLETRFMEQGLELTLLVLFATWASDSGAYFTGRFFGKHKLWPEISPKKTIEGSIGGITLAIIVSYIFNIYAEITEHGLLIIWAAIIIAVVGQIGDLVESALKRKKNVKDSGMIIPGHGGVLDRFDSLIYVFPILHLLQII